VRDMAGINIEEKPSILIYTSIGVVQEHFVDLLYGIEEEGLPFTICNQGEEDAFSLASMASEVSLLGVGIGIDSNNIVLHHERISSKEYLFSVNMSDSEIIKRELGECSARLVKMIPFKNKNL
jgi:hypothetical protein